MIYDYDGMNAEKEEWLNGDVPIKRGLIEVNFNQTGEDKAYDVNILAADLVTHAGKKLYLVYDPQSSVISPDYDSAFNVRFD